MKKTKLRRSEFIRIRLSPEERRIIDYINSEYDYTNISEHVRRTLNYYAANVYPKVLTQIKEVAHEK
jgi:hypothetical protein